MTVRVDRTVEAEIAVDLVGEDQQPVLVGEVQQLTPSERPPQPASARAASTAAHAAARSLFGDCAAGIAAVSVHTEAEMLPVADGRELAELAARR